MENNKLNTLAGKISKMLSQPQFPKLENIEFDLLMQHLREFYDELDVMRKEKNEPEKRKHNLSNRESLQPEELLIRRTLHTNEHFLLNDIHPRLEEPVLKKPEQKSTAKPEPQIQASGNNSINESIKYPGSLNEKLKSSSRNEVHKAIASKHLKDIIDLNKKFVLVNELFKGNKDHFSKAISFIDECQDYAAADNFIKTQLSSTYSWKEQSESVQLFMGLVKSKFE